MNRFSGKRAIVTGGAGRIGAAVARRIVSEGGKVVVADISADGAQRTTAEIGASAHAIRFDAGDVVTIEALVDQGVEWLGGLDILVNTAALLDPEFMAGDLDAERTSFEVWDRTMEVNVRGYMAACKYAIPHLRAAGGGSIINLSSNAGLLGDVTRIAYGSSKAAIVAMTRYIATQHGRENIRCNAITPGLIIDADLEARITEFAEKTARHVLIPRRGRPEDMAALIAFFAADESSFITGQVIACDGGALAHQPHYFDELTDSA